MKPIIAGAACAVLAAVGCSTEPPAAHVARQQRSTTEPERTIALGSDDSTTTTVPPAVTTTTTLVVEEPVTVPPTTTATVRRSTPTTVYVEPRAATQTPVVHEADRAATLACIRRYEGDYGTNTGNGYYGAYQFDLPTWYSVGGVGLPSDAEPWEQDMRAGMLIDRRGLQPWPTPSVRCR